MARYFKAVGKSDLYQQKSKLILYYFLKYTDVQNGQVVIDKDFLETILEIDSFVIRQLMLATEGVVFDYKELPNLFEFIPQMLFSLNPAVVLPVRIDRELNQSVLRTADLAAISSL